MCYCSRLLDCLRIFIREMTARINNELSKGTTLTNRNSIATYPEIIKDGTKEMKNLTSLMKKLYRTSSNYSYFWIWTTDIYCWYNQYGTCFLIFIVHCNLRRCPDSWVLIILRGTMPWCENCRVQLHPTGRSQEPYCHQAYCNSFYFRIGCRLIQQF